jgi:MFS family permease
VTAATLRQPPFALFWASRVLSTVAFQAQAVTVGWQLYTLTGNPLDLGLVGLVQFVPMILLTLVVGQVADRYDRRRIAALCQLVEATAAATLAAGSLGQWLDRSSILGVMAVVGSARAFENPTMAALLPGLVPRPLIARATAWSVSANQTAQVAGPLVGGLLVGLGTGVGYAGAAALFLLASASMTLVRMAPVARAREPVTVEAVLSGLLFIRRQPVLLGTMTLDLLAVLLGGATALLPVFARDVLQTGPWGLGLLRSAPAAGALVTSVVLAHRPPARRVGTTLVASILVFGAAIVVFGLSRWLPLSMAALCVLGASDVVSVVIRVALVQLRTPDGMRGRVSATHSLFTGTSNQLGEFRAGAVAALIGAVPAVLLGGLATIAVTVLWTRLFPEIRRIATMEE